MSFEGTNSTGTSLRSGSGLAMGGNRFVTPLLSGMLVFAGSCVPPVEVEAPRDVIRPAWEPVTGVGAGTARAAVMKPNRFQPKTDLGRRLLALREAAVAKGMRLIPAAKIVADLEEFRG